MSTLSEAIAEEFKRILTERKLSVSAAARELRVTRQAFHNYLNGKSVPRHKTLGRAMDRWDFNSTATHPQDIPMTPQGKSSCR